MVHAAQVAVVCFVVVLVERLAEVEYIVPVGIAVVGIVVAMVVGIFVESPHTLNLLRHLLLAR